MTKVIDIEHSMAAMKCCGCNVNTIKCEALHGDHELGSCFGLSLH